MTVESRKLRDEHCFIELKWEATSRMIPIRKHIFPLLVLLSFCTIPTECHPLITQELDNGRSFH
jgi:hypothetical protein